MKRWNLFSPKQQQVLAAAYCAYALWLLLTIFSNAQPLAPATLLSKIDPPEMPFYLDPPININAATVAELQLLPDIGQIIAERIVRYRDTHGRFTALEELDRIYGIGAKRLQKLRYYLFFE